MLTLYRHALELRRRQPALRSGDMTWIERSAGALAYWRGDDVFVLVNLSDEPVQLPSHDDMPIASSPLIEAPAGQGQPLSGLGADATMPGWYRPIRRSG